MTNTDTIDRVSAAELGGVYFDSFRASAAESRSHWAEFLATGDPREYTEGKRWEARSDGYFQKALAAFEVASELDDRAILAAIRELPIVTEELTPA